MGSTAPRSSRRGRSEACPDQAGWSRFGALRPAAARGRRPRRRGPADRRGRRAPAGPSRRPRRRDPARRHPEGWCTRTSEPDGDAQRRGTGGGAPPSPHRPLTQAVVQPSAESPRGRRGARSSRRTPVTPHSRERRCRVHGQLLAVLVHVDAGAGDSQLIAGGLRGRDHLAEHAADLPRRRRARRWATSAAPAPRPPLATHRAIAIPVSSGSQPRSAPAIGTTTDTATDAPGGASQARHPAAAGALVVGDDDAPRLRPPCRLQVGGVDGLVVVDAAPGAAGREQRRPQGPYVQGISHIDKARLPAMADAAPTTDTDAAARPPRTCTPPRASWPTCARRVDEAVHAGSARAVEKQHAKGKHDRPRADRAAARRGLVRRARRAGPAPRRPTSAWSRTGPYGDGVVTGYGTVDGRPVCVFTPGLHGLRRRLGEVYGEKIVKVMDLAHEDRLPGHRHQRRRRRAHPGGRGLARPLRRDLPPQRARLRRHPADLADHGPVRRRRTSTPPRSPTSSSWSTRPRRCSSPARTSSRPSPARTSRMEELGGAPHAQHASRGVAHYLAADEDDAIDYVKALLSYLPRNNLDRRRRSFDADGRPSDGHRRGPRARHAHPGLAQPALRHARRSSSTSLDDGEFLEVQPLFAPNIVVGFGRVEGRPVGIVANQPMQFAGMPRHRRLREGRPVRADLRRVQHPGAHLRRRARLPARHRPGVERHHPPRRQADLRLRRGHRPARSP